MKIIIVEDYPAIARSLERELRRILGKRVHDIAVVGNLESARTALERDTVDLLILDLNLGGEDGFDLLRSATGASAHTIIVSANTHRALEAFEYGVLDFVPKPVEPARLEKALARMDSTGTTQDDRPPLRWLSVGGRRGYELLAIGQILRIEAAGKNSELHQESGPPRIHSKTLSSLATLVPDNFVLVHRSHIVNLDFTRRLIVKPGGRYSIEMDDGTVVPVGRSRYAELRARIP